MPPPPPSSVLAAFGVDVPPRRLTGGPVHDWFAEVAPTIAQDGFRLATPASSRFASWSFEGWSATEWVAGRQPDLGTPDAWTTILTAGRAFHRATAHLPRPTVLSGRSDWWAIADQAAWGEREIDLRPEFAQVARRLAPLLEPLGESQIVHADLTLNVLVEPGLDPAIIDISPYWRPVAYAEGVALADALCWHDADSSLLGQLEVPVAAVARALLFRMFTTVQQVGRVVAEPDCEALRRYEHAAALLGA